MKSVRVVLLAGALVLALFACSRDQPPAPGLHSLRGRVRLTGYLVDAQGNFAGTRVVGDADGVRIELLDGSNVIARTTTVDGVYSFPGLPSGAYVARSRVIDGIANGTKVLTITSTDLVAGDTIALVSRGDLLPVPNPFVTQTVVYFDLPDTEWIDVRVLGMAGDTVRTLLSGVRPRGLNQLRWDGLDRNGVVAGAALYWVTFAAGNDYRAQLLFR